MQGYDLDFLLHESKATRGKSSLLIPSYAMDFFRVRCEEFGSKRSYFAWMVQHGFVRLPEFQDRIRAARGLNWNTVYQARGCHLTKKNFIPDSSDWECFRHMAASIGVSICFLFVFLMELDRAGLLKTRARPEKQPLGWSSMPKSAPKGGKFRKFSKFVRFLDRGRGNLHRKIQFN